MIQFFGEFWSVAIPIIGISAAVAAALFVACFATYRWQRFKALLNTVYRFILHRPQYNYNRIFELYLERIDAVSDRRELFGAILELTAKILSADGASLLVRDAEGKFSLRATYGVKPFIFDVSEVPSFISWLDTKRQMITRRYLLNSKKCRDIKIEGLRYCVQFTAEACVPIFVNSKLYALLNLGSRKRGMYDGETRALLSLMGLQFATAIHNANLYQTLIKQNAKLQQASTFKNQLLSNLSHELRTPLNSIIGLSEHMAEGGDGQVNGDQMHHLSMIRQSGQRLLNTVTAMVDLSKIESNRLELNVRHLSLGRLVSEAASKIKLNKGTKLEVDLKGEVPGVYGDEIRLREVFRHLLDNAAKFTEQGKITVGASKAGEMIKVSIKDTGVGIRKEARKNIFDGFAQADGGHTRNHEGLGLGLSISRKIVELHGGRMWFKSQLGKGSEFFFTLPLKPTTVRHNEVR